MLLTEKSIKPSKEFEGVCMPPNNKITHLEEAEEITRLFNEAKGNEEAEEITRLFNEAKDNEVFMYAVYRNSLVFLFRSNGYLRAGILATKNDTCFGIPLHWPRLYILNFDAELYGTPRKATLEDFHFYKVCPPRDLFQTEMKKRQP